MKGMFHTTTWSGLSGSGGASAGALAAETDATAMMETLQAAGARIVPDVWRREAERLAAGISPAAAAAAAAERTGRGRGGGRTRRPAAATETTPPEDPVPGAEGAPPAGAATCDEMRDVRLVILV